MKTKGITATVIFESAAVNRDEKLAGNITSIKKLSRFDGTYSFLSRAFIRHHMFVTFKYLFDWKDAPTVIAKEVIQHDFPKANIVEYPEIDFFGFMRTEDKQNKKKTQQEETENGGTKDQNDSNKNSSIIRKAPLGITKAISIETWQGDMAFYANHDMVRRATLDGYSADPNPFQKEEHYSFYRLSFTLDLCRLGYQDICIVGEDNLKAFINWWEKYSDILSSEDKEGLMESLDDLGRSGCFPQEMIWRKISKSDKSDKVHGFVGFLKDNKAAKNNKMARVAFVLSKSKRHERIRQFLTVLKNGLIVHSSTEDYGMVPLFIILGNLKVPAPIFNSEVRLKDGKIGAEPLNRALKNDYLLEAWYDGDLPVDGTLTGDALKKWDSVDAVLKAINEREKSEIAPEAEE